MGTRGFTGLIIDGQEKIGYQQYDSYPDGVGLAVLTDLRELVKDRDKLDKAARALRVVADTTPPTIEEQIALLGNADPRVSSGALTEWYVLLRDTHGKLREILECGYVEDHREFPLDSLFCEWGYLVDLDKGVFEVYEGFQKTPPVGGRWAGRPASQEIQDARVDLENQRNAGALTQEQFDYFAHVEYYAVELVGTWPLDELPDDDEFLATLQPQED